MTLTIGGYYNFANVSTLIFITTLIFLHEVFSTAAFLYLALYFSYVVCWALKHWLFPTPRFDRELNMLGLVCRVPILFGAYWLLPYLAIVSSRDTPITNFHVFCSICCFCIGLSTIMASDAENYYLLLHAPEDVGKMGLTRLIVAPNLLGEAVVYASFAILSQSWVSWAVLAGVFVAIFYPINVIKAQTLADYFERWQVYQTTGASVFLPDLRGVLNSLSASASTPSSTAARAHAHSLRETASPLEEEETDTSTDSQGEDAQRELGSDEEEEEEDEEDEEDEEVVATAAPKPKHRRSDDNADGAADGVEAAQAKLSSVSLDDCEDGDGATRSKGNRNRSDNVGISVISQKLGIPRRRRSVRHRSSKKSVTASTDGRDDDNDDDNEEEEDDDGDGDGDGDGDDVPGFSGVIGSQTRGHKQLVGGTPFSFSSNANTKTKL
jgi:hypothetical protein